MGIIIFTFFIVGGVSLISIFYGENSSFVDEDKYESFNKTFNVMSNVESEVTEIQDNIENADTDFGLFGVLNSLINSAWQSLKLLFTSFTFMGNVWTGLTTIFGVPAWVATLIGLLVVVLLAFAIFSVIFQRDV